MISCTKTTEKQIDKELSERYRPGERDVVVVYLCASNRVRDRLAEAYGKKGRKVKPGSDQREGAWLEFTA